MLMGINQKAYVTCVPRWLLFGFTITLFNTRMMTDMNSKSRSFWSTTIVSYSFIDSIVCFVTSCLARCFPEMLLSNTQTISMFNRQWQRPNNPQPLQLRIRSKTEDNCWHFWLIDANVEQKYWLWQYQEDLTSLRLARSITMATCRQNVPQGIQNSRRASLALLSTKAHCCSAA